MKLRLLFLIVLIPYSVRAADLACSIVMAKISELDETARTKIEGVITQLKTLDTRVINGEALPQWKDFLNLLQIRTNVFEITQELSQKHSKKYIEESSQILGPAFREDLTNIPSHTSNPLDMKYTPTDYGLRVAYQKMIMDINRLLPRFMRIPIRRIPYDHRLSDLKKAAIEFMKKFETRFEARFPTTGYDSLEAYETALRASDDPDIKKALSLIDGNQIQVAMRRPPNGRFWIPKVGFHNQHVTGSTKGYFGPEGRRTAEGTLYEVSKEEIFSFDPEFLPKYGLLQLIPHGNIRNDLKMTSGYGKDIYIFDTGKISDRLSFYLTDSLFLGNQSGGSFYDQKVGTPKTWDASVIPWRFRILLASFFGDIKNFGYPRFNRAIPLTRPVDQAGGYFEAQVLGPLSLSDVEIFQFTTTPPRGAFLKELLHHHIEIQDLRSGTPVDWVPDTEHLNSLELEL